ncbi:MAG: hypothetical protein LBD11_05635 [Candidatus Peribacteria bacterium]|jgi:cyanophycin synthetase|nr:hypothetical protein [Candidatus Peribacteria bacterium]
MHPRNSCLCEIYLDDIAEKFLKDTRVKLSDIPAKGEKVYIRPNSNVSGGGNCHDVTDSVHPSVISIAREILQKLTLPYVGIDFMTKDITKKQTKNSYSICELNTMPGLSLHTHEETGRVRNVAGALVDLIYPETKEK